MCLAKTLPKENTLKVFLCQKKKILRFKEIGGVHLKQMSKFLETIHFNISNQNYVNILV